MPQLIPAAAAAVKAAAVAGFTGGPSIGYSVAKFVAGIAITAGLGALARAQIPDPESGKQSLKQPRPERLVFMGAPSHGGPPYTGGERQ